MRTQLFGALADNNKAGKYFPLGDKQPRYLLLNGHRRVATLCFLAANREIPLDWLLQIPVEVHPVRGDGGRDYLKQMTAERHLSLEQVLSDITIDDVSPTVALEQLNAAFPADRRDWMKPLSIVHLDDLYQISWEELLLLATSNSSDPLWRGILEFARDQRTNPDPHWSSVLWQWPGLIAIRFLFNAYKNETSTALRGEMENALHRMLLAIWGDGFWGNFERNGHWSPEDLREMRKILGHDSTP